MAAGLLWRDEIGVVASEVFDVHALLSSLESLARCKPDVAVVHDRRPPAGSARSGPSTRRSLAKLAQRRLKFRSEPRGLPELFICRRVTSYATRDAKDIAKLPAMLP